MKILKYYCNRCEKDITEYPYLKVEYTKGQIKFYTETNHYCPTCYDIILKILEENK